VKYVLLAAIILLSYPAIAQDVTVRSVAIQISPTSSHSIYLGTDFIVPGSLEVSVDSSVPLREGKDYLFDKTTNSIILLDAARSLLFSGNDSNSSYRIVTNYKVIPIKLRRNYSNSSLLFPDTISKTIIQPSPQFSSTSEATSSSISFSNNGGFTRGITVGSNQDVTTQSSFNLTFNGNVDRSLTFQGALSEESTAIQPEGNTQLLRDLDRIFINFDYLNTVRVSLGDMYMTSSLPITSSAASFFPAPIYTNLERKVLGANATADSKVFFAQAGAATTRGKYYTNYFQGENGFQGPYRLYAPSGERNIIIIAGTERIYIDGSLMERGEQNDYIIDYSTSEIRFQPRRIITNLSRINIDFQYTDEKYSRNLFTASLGGIEPSGTIGLRGIYLREGDNQHAPRNITLSDADKAIIASAGSDPTKAIKSGSQFVGRDSTGKARGIYAKFDSSSSTIYRYLPGDTNSLYLVNFSFVGNNKGNYRRISSTHYEYIGTNSGDYDTVVFLPLPSMTQLIGGQLSAKFIDSSLSITTEYTRSIYEANRFAPQLLSNGNSYIITGNYNNFNSKTIGISVSGYERFQDSLFHSIDRTRSAESLRRFGVEDTSSTSNYNYDQERERLYEARIQLNDLQISGKLGSYTNYSTNYSADNITTGLRLTEDTAYIPTLNASYSRIPSVFSDGLHSDWNLLTIGLSKRFTLASYSFKPFVHYGFSDKKSTRSNVLQQGSFNNTRYDGGVEIIGKELSGKVQASYFTDDSLRTSYLSKISKNYQYQFQFNGSISKDFSVLTTVSILEKKYIDSTAKVTSRGDFTNYYLSFVPRYRTNNNVINADARVDLLSELSSKIEKVFIETEPGYGSYRYIGDVNGNNIQDPSEFEIARYSDQANYILTSRPTTTLFPTTSNVLGLRFKLSPSYFQLPNAMSFLSIVSSETSLKFENRTLTSPHLNNYFNLISVFNDSSTLNASILIQEDLYLFEQDVNKQLRFRFIERRGLSQYDLGAEKSYHRTLSIRGQHSSYSKILLHLTLVRWQKTLIPESSVPLLKRHTRLFLVRSVLLLLFNMYSVQII
jgi:hypothetical protein